MSLCTTARLLSRCSERYAHTRSQGPSLSHAQVFGLNRFRETELIHGRWAMLATLGVVVAEATTGVAWQDAGKVELDGASYLGFGLPFTVTCVVTQPPPLPPAANAFDECCSGLWWCILHVGPTRGETFLVNTGTQVESQHGDECA